MRKAAFVLFCTVLGFCSVCLAADPALTLAAGDVTRRYTLSELLARPEAADLRIPASPISSRPVTYRAVPLLSLLGDLPLDPFDTLQTRATDGFVAEIPLSLVLKGRSGGAAAWIALEPPGHPWPIVPGQSASPGPFFLVWQHPERSGVGSEQWPYALMSLVAAESPAHRWPQLEVDPHLPPGAPARRGQAVFVTQCLPCHRMQGGGASEMGPDLGRPMNATAYLTEPGLRALIRDPKSVRTWPLQQMQGFDQAMLPEADLDAVIAYLRAKALSQAAGSGD